MDKRLGFAMVLGASALAWIGCDNPPPEEDGGVCVPGPGVICLDDAGTDAGPGTDSGPEQDSGPEVCRPAPVGGATAGSMCRNGGTMCTGMACNQELGLTFGTLYEDSMCGDVCNPNAATDECGECADCSEFTYAGRLRIPELGPPVPPSMFLTVLSGVCRPLCTPSATDNGGCRNGYTCDIDRGVCVDGCENDGQCNLDPETLMPVLGGGPWTCNATTGRCELEGTAGAAAGDPCTVDTECMDDGQCLTGDAIPGGFCTRIGCNNPGFECGTDETCSLVGLGGPSWCLPQCTVGEEPAADQLGTDGHGAGCPTGQACTWNGQGNEPVGGCFPGEYNDITTPNVGAACQSAADCYSPFGYAACIFSGEANVDSGMCAISNCARFMGAGGTPVDGIMPGVETETRVCDSTAGEVCVDFSGGAPVPQTFCVLTCDSAAECAPGYACAPLLSDGKLCWPFCENDSDCRAGATCQDPDSTTGAACNPNGPDGVPNTGDEPDCFCSDRMPRTDAGVEEADAGTDGGSTADAGTDAGVADAGVDAATP